MRSEQHPGLVSFEWAPVAAGGWALFGEANIAARLLPGPRAWTAEAGAEAWTLQRVGFHRPRVVARAVGAPTDVAHALSDWRGIHALHFASGPTWEIDPSHSGGTVVRDEGGRTVMRLVWNGRRGVRVQADAALWPGRFGALAGVVAGFLVLDGLAAPGGRLAYGVPIGHTARSRFS